MTAGSARERVLIATGPGSAGSARVREIMSRYGPAGATFLVAPGERPAAEACRPAEVLEYGPGASPGLFSSLRGRHFTRAFLVAREFDFRLALPVWFAGAPECRYLPEGEGEGMEIRIGRILLPLSRRLFIFVFFPVLLLPLLSARLLFFLGKVPPAPGPAPPAGVFPLSRGNPGKRGDPQLQRQGPAGRVPAFRGPGD